MQYVRRLEKSASKWFAVAYVEGVIIVMLLLVILLLVVGS